MPLGGFGFLSLFYLFLGVRFLLQFIPRRKEIFDNNFTASDRSMTGQAAFFVLLPLSVALHELGHAIAIWAMGGKVLDFGFYFFSGYVSYDPRGFSDVQRTLIAFAGTFVNLILIVLTLAVVFLKKPPLRAPWNELLLQFVFISGINALVFLSSHGRPLTGCPATGRRCTSGVPWLTGIIVAVQVGFLAAGWWAWKNPRIRTRIAALTGQPTGATMRIGFRRRWPASRAKGRIHAILTGDEKTAGSAVNRVAAGWSPKPTVRIDRGQGNSVTSMIWQSNDADRTVAVVVRPNGEAAIVGNVHSRRDPGAAANQGLVRSYPAVPAEDDLTMAVRVAAEQVDTWAAAPPNPQLAVRTRASLQGPNALAFVGCKVATSKGGHGGPRLRHEAVFR